MEGVLAQARDDVRWAVQRQLMRLAGPAST